MLDNSSRISGGRRRQRLCPLPQQRNRQSSSFRLFPTSFLDYDPKRIQLQQSGDEQQDYPKHSRPEHQERREQEEEGNDTPLSINASETQIPAGINLPQVTYRDSRRADSHHIGCI